MQELDTVNDHSSIEIIWHIITLKAAFFVFLNLQPYRLLVAALAVYLMMNALTPTRFVSYKASDKYIWSVCRRLWPAEGHPGVHSANLHTVPQTDVVWSVRAVRGGYLLLRLKTTSKNTMLSQDYHFAAFQVHFRPLKQEEELNWIRRLAPRWLWVVHVDPAVMKHLSLLSNDPSAGMSVCLTGSLSLILSPSPQTGESTSFTQASKTPFFFFFSPSRTTLLPRRSCLSLWIPTKQALMASRSLTWVNGIQPRQRHVWHQLL